MEWLKRYIKRMPNKYTRGLIGLLLIAFIAINTYFIYTITLFDNIENFLRYSAIGITVIIFTLMCLYCFNTIIKNKFTTYFLFIFILLLISMAELFIIFNINKLFSTMNKVNKEYVTYSTSLVALKDSSINEINDVKSKKIGIISNKDNIEGYIISQDIIVEHELNNNNEIVEYDDFVYMVNDLYEQNIDVIFLSSNYYIMFSSVEHFENIENETKVIISKDKKMVKQNTISQTKEKKLTEPFTILLMGVDSPYDGLDKNAAFNGDALMLITFNPITLNATMLSIPRDTYVPIMCFRGHIENKITHAAWYGESCMIKTIENFTGIDIDYYMKINFKGVVKLVNALGGITIDVPIEFCEQNSDRASGSKKICLKKGLQKLNGEQALALSRHRKTLASADLQRGQHQQLVVNGMVNKLKEITNLNQVYKILDAISNNIDSNLTTNQILEFYSVGKDILAKAKNNNDSDIITMQKLFLNGYGHMIWDEGMRRSLYNFIYYKGSLKDVVTAMKINLEIEKPALIKEFEFSINNPYTPTIIGKKVYNETRIPVVPDFTKSNRNYAVNWGNQKNVNINFITINKDSEEYKDGQIIEQSIPATYRLDKLNKETGITLKIVSKSSIPIKINCSLEENSDNPACLIPDFVGESWTITRFNTWKAKVSGSFMINTIMIDIDDLAYDITKPGIIFEQNKEAGTKIVNIAELIIKYYAVPKEEVTEEEKLPDEKGPKDDE